MLKWWKSRIRSLGRDTTYIRFWPNPGFSFRIGRSRWLHWCRACGWTTLGPGQVRRGVGRRSKRG